MFDLYFMILFLEISSKLTSYQAATMSEILFFQPLIDNP